MAELLYRLGRLAARRSKTVIAAWFAVLLITVGLFAVGNGTLSNSFSIPGTPTAEVTERLETELPESAGGSGTVVVQTEDGSEFTDEQQEAVRDRIDSAAEVSGVEAVVDPFDTGADRADQREQIEDGRAELEDGRAQLEAGQDELDAGREQAEAAGMLEMAEPQLDAEQTTIDENRAELELQSEQLEYGADLLDMSAEVRTVSEDGSAAMIPVSFTEAQMEVSEDTKTAVMDAFSQNPVDGVAVDFSSDLADQISGIVGAGEVIGLVVAAVVLMVMLGTFVGAGLPILTALIGVGIGALGALSLSSLIDMASVTPVLGLMLGLAVGIDYCLFIVNRHRTQLKQGYALGESIGLANGTSGNAVVFAGTTVLIALLALNVTGIPFLGLMGSVGAFCVAIAVLIAITLTPALLSLIGPRILRRRERAERASSAPKAQPKQPTPMSTPAALLRVVAAVAVLLALAVPALDLRLGIPDGSTEAPDSTTYQAYSTVEEKFGAGQNGPLLVVADMPRLDSDEEELEHQAHAAEQLYSQDGVVAVAPVGTSEDGRTAAFQVVPEEGPTSESTVDLVHDLRSLSPQEIDYPIAVAGTASGNIDISEKLAEALPVYLAVVIGLSLVIMALVFRSLLVPVIATAGFILSFFASLGAVVAIYQWNWLGAVFGVNAPGPVLNFLPTLLVGVLFGLAMDYMLFIGSGMREAYAHGARSRVAVVQGVRSGRAVVTAAAIIMVAVFGGFVFSHMAMIRPIGFALAFGVLVDAFVVRLFLVPALMHLAGDKAWWLPKWLDRLMPDVDVEGASLERRHPHGGAESESAAESAPVSPDEAASPAPNQGPTAQDDAGTLR